MGARTDTVGQLGTRGKGWEKGGKNNKRKNNNLAGINYIPRGRTKHLTTTKDLDYLDKLQGKGTSFNNSKHLKI